MLRRLLDLFADAGTTLSTLGHEPQEVGTPAYYSRSQGHEARASRSSGIRRSSLKGDRAVGSPAHRGRAVALTFISGSRDECFPVSKLAGGRKAADVAATFPTLTPDDQRSPPLVASFAEELAGDNPPAASRHRCLARGCGWTTPGRSSHPGRGGRRTLHARGGEPTDCGRTRE